MTCPRCKSPSVLVQAVSTVKTKHRGCLGWFFWLLLAVCTAGLILIIPLITNSKVKSKVYHEAICQNCGNRWRA